MTGPSSLEIISPKLQWIAKVSRERPEQAWTTLAHHIDLPFLRVAYERTRKDGAVGIDKQTASEFAADLDANLERLLYALKTGVYRAPAVRRVYLPKGKNQKRPIGIPTFADKVLQRAVVMVLEAVYEQDFLDCSYGFRPNRSAHQALQALRSELMATYGGVVLEIDIESFFESIDHAHLRSFLDKRIRDGVLRRVIGKWLNAGVMEAGNVQRTTQGSPQGGVVSPILSNLYLHEVLDVWFHREVKPRLYGKASLIRYADDAVLVFTNSEDARRVFEVLPKRFAKYGLRLHPKKTRLIPFRSPPRKGSSKENRPGSFEFLGFTLYWGLSRKGNKVVKQKTASNRLSRSLHAIAQWCKRNRHLKVCDQREILGRKMQGHYAYYGITGNAVALQRFAHQVEAIWRKWLGRRSWAGKMTWERFHRLKKRYPLPAPRIVHSYLVAKP